MILLPVETVAFRGDCCRELIVLDGPVDSDLFIFFFSAFLFSFFFFKSSYATESSALEDARNYLFGDIYEKYNCAGAVKLVFVETLRF